MIVDPHYQLKHSGSMDDGLILKLVRSLDTLRFVPESINAEGLEYYRTDPLEFEGKVYRLVWLQHPDEDYVGVVNAFRRPYGKSFKISE